jgi:hypothetical protein
MGVSGSVSPPLDRSTYKSQGVFITGRLNAYCGNHVVYRSTFQAYSFLAHNIYIKQYMQSYSSIFRRKLHLQATILTDHFNFFSLDCNSNLDYRWGHFPKHTLMYIFKKYESGFMTGCIVCGFIFKA